MHKIGLLLVVAGGLAATGLLAGCGPQADTTKDKKLTKLPALCAKCGQVKGSAVCCRKGVAKCAKCGLAKGAPGCCAIPKGATGAVTLCGKCGQAKGAAVCCRKGAAKCGHCGLAAGSPGHKIRCGH